MNAFTRVFPTTAAPTPGGPSSSRKLGPLTERQAALGGVVLVVAAGLYTAHKSKQSGTSGNLGQTNASTDTLGSGAYDSTANDVYDALQPQVEGQSSALDGFSGQLDQISSSQAALAESIGALSTSASVPAPTPTPAKHKVHAAAPKPHKKAPAKPRPAHPAPAPAAHTAQHPAKKAPAKKAPHKPARKR